MRVRHQGMREPIAPRGLSGPTKFSCVLQRAWQTASSSRTADGLQLLTYYSFKEPNFMDERGRRLKFLFTSMALCLSPFLLFDAIVSFGRNAYPEAISHFACSILPYLKPASPFVPHPLTDYARTQCLVYPVSLPDAAAISIVFFLFKIALIQFLLTTLILWILILPLPMPSSLKKMRIGLTQERVDEISTDGFVADFKSIFPAILGLPLVSLFLYLTLDAIPRHSLSGHALKGQDIYCFTLGITLALLVFYSASLLAYGASRFRKHLRTGKQD
jgi:hypothetical protein